MLKNNICIYYKMLNEGNNDGNIVSGPNKKNNERTPLKKGNNDVNIVSGPNKKNNEKRKYCFKSTKISISCRK